MAQDIVGSVPDIKPRPHYLRVAAPAKLYVAVPATASFSPSNVGVDAPRSAAHLALATRGCCRYALMEKEISRCPQPAS